MSNTTFDVRVAIHFTAGGCALAFGCNNKVTLYSKFQTQKRQGNNKIATSILLNENDEITAFGEGAASIYARCIGKQRTDWKYVQNLKTALCGDNFDRLLAVNGETCAAQNVFVKVFQEIHKVVMEYLDKNEVKGTIQWIIAANNAINNSPKARENIKQWMIEAGLVDRRIPNQCLIVSESDCAALSVFKNISKSDDSKQESIGQNATYIIVDCQEKDVNISFCTVFRKGMIEIVPSVNGEWGIDSIDGEFIKLLKDIFSEFEDCIQNYQQMYPNHFLLESGKHSFFEDPKALTHSIRLPYEFVAYLEQKCKANNTSLKDKLNSYKMPIQHIRNLFGNDCGQNESKEENIECTVRTESNEDETQYLCMDINIWKCLFDSKINPIINAIQSNADNGCVYLFGDFALSNYFRQRMKDTFGESESFQVIFPDEPHLSVVKAAADFDEGFKIWSLRLKNEPENRKNDSRSNSSLSATVASNTWPKWTKMVCLLLVYVIMVSFASYGMLLYKASEFDTYKTENENFKALIQVLGTGCVPESQLKNNTNVTETIEQINACSEALKKENERLNDTLLSSEQSIRQIKETFIISVDGLLAKMKNESLVCNEES